MSSRPEGKTTQFVSLTMRLKDKLHPQRIKRSEQIKHSLSNRTEPADVKLQDKTVCVLADRQRAVVNSLQYFKALVDRLGVDTLVQDQSVVGHLLGGASSRVLEAVQSLVEHHSKTISTCPARLYQSLAQLIRWTDQVVMQGVTHNNKESKASVTTVIRSVLDGVKDLVRLAAERHEATAPLSPVHSQSTEVSTKESSDWVSTATAPAGHKEQEKMEEQMVVSPPKPPIPLVHVSPPQAASPPALPPKKRLSSLGPASCRVAIVAPMRRQPEAKQHVQQESEDDECLKQFSSSADNTHCEDDPDYDFLHKDLSSSKTLPPLPPPSFLPPALPEKRCRSTTGATNSQTPSNLEHDFTHKEESFAHCDDIMDPGEAPCTKAPPPPSREKTTQFQLLLLRDIHLLIMLFTEHTKGPVLWTHKPHNSHVHYIVQSIRSSIQIIGIRCSSHFRGHRCIQSSTLVADWICSRCRGETRSETCLSLCPVHQYLEVCSSYSAPSTAMFYQRPHYNSKAQDVETTYELTHPHRNTPELPSAPLLPLKKKQQDSSKDHEETNTNQSRESSQSLQQEKEEVLLTSQQEILSRIVMKSEDEEGPDVKAATAEILLVYAAESKSSTGLVLFCEAFLLTYRSFINPKEIICKLQHRYRHLSEECEPLDPNVTRNTFHLLLRVVDGLCVIELESDLLLLLMDLVSGLLIGGELELANLLHCSILSKIEQKWQLIGSPQWHRPLAARSVAARPGTLLDFRSQDLAEQLTLLDSELFYKIELPEVLLWSKEQNEEKSPNLTEFTQHFNNVSFWVRSVIILQDKPQDREKLLLKFLKIMKHLRKLNNFNSYLSILSALDSAPLRRLDWQKNTAEALEEFGSLIDSSSSFRAYRAALAEAEPPCIPYLGLILQDLTFVHLGNPDTLMTSQGLKVNFSKRWQQFNIIDTLRSYQQIPYCLQPNDDIISFFNDFSDHLAEEALWELSLRLRPRNTPRVNHR
ncbi:rap guanine nucleotide exchange factor 1 [Betta splendens]|uniref:CRK SH3-binding GNRP n=1 Tax=Betta splendens TaxID=158456 RepID=A0A9W2Y2C2_BETSP|nr:rap guanine nucleotide exchange factor 1 [Betta splendens]